MGLGFHMLNVGNAAGDMSIFSGAFLLMHGVSTGAFAAVVIGLGHRWLLQKQISIVSYGGWLTSLATGLIVGYAIAYTIVAPIVALQLQLHSSGSVSWIVSGAIVMGTVGAAVGVSQWFALRSLLKRAELWVIASTVAWSAGGAVYWLAYWLVGGPFFYPWTYGKAQLWPGWTPLVLSLMVGWLTGGIVVGVITGIALRRILSISGEPLIFSSDSSTPHQNSKDHNKRLDVY